MKDRLDIILTEKGLFSSREKAKASIMAGLVYVDGSWYYLTNGKYDTSYKGVTEKNGDTWFIEAGTNNNKNNNSKKCKT